MHTPGNALNGTSRVGERLEALLKRAIALVQTNRAAVDALADQLLTRRLLQAAEIDELLRPFLTPERTPHAELG
ncbi:hypothetical protein WH91_17795 [Devosia psychrophila]|uniref:Peptidase family M41 n=1 Tax=Devosia psychrophila TaxID=728005 RepID=A0ABR5DUN8_9HYPH|nr:hypothetical protein WH91_17795 [Devosia psychrophila]